MRLGWTIVPGQHATGQAGRPRLHVELLEDRTAPALFAADLPLTSLDGGKGWRTNGLADYDRLGYSVSGAGDVNGDGIDDMILGAIGASGGGSTRGQSYVVFGRNGDFTTELDLSTLDGMQGFRITGLDDNDLSGWSVSEAGDVNGDGFGDLIIGAPWAEGVAASVGRATWYSAMVAASRLT